MFAEPRWYCVS